MTFYLRQRLKYRVRQVIGLHRCVSTLSKVKCTGNQKGLFHKCNLNIHSMNHSYALNLICFILDKISNNIPDVTIVYKYLNIPTHIKLADPECDTPSSINMLIGAEVF